MIAPSTPGRNMELFDELNLASPFQQNLLKHHFDIFNYYLEIIDFDKNTYSPL